MASRRVKNIQKAKHTLRKRHNILSRTPGEDTGPQEEYTYIETQFRQWLSTADGALLLADNFISQYEKEQRDIGGQALSDEEKKEVEGYAHNHVREVMEKAFAD